MTAFAVETLSYSGRLVQASGAPVAGPVKIRADLAYTNATGSVLCTDEISSVALSKGVFHVKIEFDCSLSGKTLTQVLSQTPAGHSVAIQITDITDGRPPKSYSFQALHAMPYATVASQLVQMGANDGEFLKWNDTDKKWEAGNVSGASGGTVTNVTTTSPLSVTSGTTTPALTISQANSTTNGYLSSADWNTFNNKEGTLAGGTATQYYRGDKTWQTLDTSAVPENVNLYFTNARVLGLALTGFSATNSAIIATDTVIQGFSKAQGQINSLNSAAGTFLVKNSSDSITGTVNVGATGFLTITNPPSILTDATNKQYVDTGVNAKVSKSGDTMSGVLTLDNDLKIKGGSNYVTVKGHASSAVYDLVLPSSAGTSGYVLRTDGAGNLSWIDPSSVSAGTGTVGSGSITDNSIVDADINTGAAIAQSKIANLTTDLAAKVSTTLNSGNILVGSGTNVATAVTVSGDATLANTGALTLKNTGTAGSYTRVTTDAQGRVTSGTNPTTLLGYGITDAVTSVTVSAPLTVTGTTAPNIAIPAATASASGHLTSSDWNTFNGKQAAITASSTITTGSITSKLQGGVIVDPYGAGAGNTGELRFKELSGTNYIALKAPDSIASSITYTLPAADGTTGQVLMTNATGGLSWTTVATGATNLTGDIGGTIGSNTIGTGKVTLTHLSATGTKDNTTYLRGDNTFATFAADVRTSILTGLSTSTNAVITATDTILGSLGKLQKQISDFAVSAVGGDLSGNLPNPTVAKIQGRAVTSTAPLAGQVLKYNSGTPAWEPSYVLVGDLKSSALGNLFPGTGCAANQTLYYSVVGDAFTCVNIDSLDAGKITTGTIAAARLPSSATYWQAATGGINFAGGNVGIGTTTPSRPMQIVAASVVASDNRSVLSLRDNTPLAASTGGGIDFGGVYNSSGTQAEWAGIKSIKSNAVDGEYGAHMSFMTRLHGIGTTEKMRITDSGSVGIGTSSPAATLHIQGSSAGPIMTRIQNTSSTGYTSVRLFNDANDIYRALEIDYTGSAYASAALTGGPVGEAASIGTTGAYPLVFGTNNTARMVISSTGNLEVNGKIRGATSSNLDLSSLGGPIYFRPTTYSKTTTINGTIIDDSANGASLGDVVSFSAGWTGASSITKSVGIMPGMYDIYVRIRTNGAGNLPTSTAFGIYDNNTTTYPFQTTLNNLTTSYQELYAGRTSLTASILSHSTVTYFSTAVATTTYYVDYVKLVPATNFASDVGIGTTAAYKLDVNGLTALAGQNANLDPAGSPNLAPILNSGRMLVGWNRNAGAGEIDLISNRGGGHTGGFNFYDYTNAGVLNLLMSISGTGNVGVNGTITTNNGFIGTNLINGSFGVNTGRAFMSPSGYIWSTMDNGGGSSNLYLHRHDVSQYYVQFGYGASNVGTISTNGSSVSYNTTSDYRLKENVIPMDDALKRVLLIQPKRFNYITTPNETVDGFIAHELAVAVPEAVHGKKDAVDKDGKMIPQFVDYSKVIPVVTGAVKELYNKFVDHDNQIATQSRTIASDKAEIENLKVQNKKLQQENEAIKKYLCKKDPSAPICK